MACLSCPVLREDGIAFESAILHGANSIAIRMLKGLGIGLELGFGMFAPFWDGAFFWGRLSPGSLAPSARRSPGAIQGLAPSGPLRVQLPLGSAIQGVAPPGNLASNDHWGCLRSTSLRDHSYSGPVVCRTWLKGTTILVFLLGNSRGLPHTPFTRNAPCPTSTAHFSAALGGRPTVREGRNRLGCA